MRLIAVLFGTQVFLNGFSVWCGDLDVQGPVFLQEPQHRLDFSNSSGGRLDCTAHGSPIPEIEWIQADGSSVTQIPDIRMLYPNGSMGLLPFSADRYRHDVHAATYRCRLRNPIGTVLSREVHIKAVIRQKYDIQVHDEYVIAGNTAVLKCKVPSYVADYIMVTSWVQDGSVDIYPNTDIDGKYVVLSNGDLYINNAGPTDGYKNYACRTVHRLTGEVQVSTYPGRIIVTEARDGSTLAVHQQAPRVTVDRYSARRVVLGHDVTLPCVAQGYPLPTYQWRRELQGQTVPIALDERLQLLSTGLLKISKVRLEDRGVYLCYANNSRGAEIVRITLEIRAPLSAYLQPQAQLVDVGRQVRFQCIVGGYPVTQITWLHDGKLIVPDMRVVILVDPAQLNIRQLMKEDRGMYQCIASNNWDQIQAGAELSLGDARPELTYYFSEQTLQPGPALSLKCVASGNPPPQFTWQLDGFPIPQDSRFMAGQYVTVQDDVISHINITLLKSEDGGDYSCIAQNSVDKVSHTARINVFGLPFIRPMLRVTAIAGGRLSIKCPVAGYPIETVTWERAGQTLPINRRQRVYANGTLTIEQTQRTEDAGTYTCQAQNRQKNTSRRDVEVQVTVPPKILPINPMTDLLREGMRAGITCQIMEGDLPISFRWGRNGQPVANNVTHGTVLRRIDEFSSSLVIDPVTSAHSGNYTCVASNLAGEERYIVPLTVNVPPRWTVEPSDINVATGQEAMLNCQADGYPSPVITWKKAVGQQPGEYKDFLFERNVHQYQNGSLNIIDIFKDSEGHYLCEAKNNIGTGVSKVIFLKVNAPAHFTDKVKQVRVGRYEQAHIQCTALGDTPMEILWRIGAHYIGGAGSGHLAHEQRYSVREQILAEGMVSELTIGRTQREDTGALTCTATNLYGKDEMDIQLIVQEIPEMPKNVQVSDQLSRSIGVTWTQPFTGNSPITNYIVQYKEVQEMWPAQAQKVLVPGTQTIISVDNLKPAQNYHLRILAENRMGLSEPSQVVQVGTLDEVPGGAPVQINLEPISSTEIRVDWDSPLRDTWNGKLLGYHVGYKELSAGDVVDNNSGVGGTEKSHAPSVGTDPLSYTFKSVEVRPHYGGEAILQGLRKYYNYSIIVQAYNSRGSGPASDPLITRTNEDAPSLPPVHVLCDVQGAQTVQINWQSPLPEGRNGIISGYKVTYHSVGEWFDNDDQQTKIISQLRANILGLRKYTNYSISVLAFTGGGDGVKSDATFCHTDEDVPSAPADIKAVLNGSNRILVTWLPPKHSNGILMGYTFYMSTLVEGREEGTNKRTLAPNVDWYETLKVQNGATCQFWVTASTRIGEGDSSRVLSLTIPSSFASTSSIPQLSPRIASFGREILTVWRRNISLPCRRVGGIGAPPPAALWEANDLPLETGGRRSVAANGTLFLRDVQHSDEGNYTCRIADDHGHDQITYRVRILVAPRAPILTVVDTYADSLHLRWLDQHNGGSPILGYVINYKREHGDWEELTIDSRTDDHMLRNLQCGTRYLLYITAYNKIGTGLPCDIVTTYTKGTVPISPNQSQMLTTNSTVVTAWLDSWGDGGCGILYFIIEYHLLSSADDGKWLMAANHIKPTERIISIRDLTPGTTYQLKVTAFNNAGESWAIYNFNTLTVSGGMPETITPTEEWTGYYVIFRIITPLLIVILLTAWISVGFLKKKKFFGGNCTTNTNAASATSQLSESPTLTQLQNKQNNDKKYLAVRTAAASCGSAALIPGIRAQRMQPSLPSAGIDLDSVGHRLNNAYKTETDYIEDICPYATFQLGNKVAYSESSYSGNIYSGPYHSVHGSFLYHDVKSVPSRHQEHTLQIPRTDDDDPSVLDKYQMHTKEHEYTKVRRKGGRLRDPHSGSQESDNWGSTDSEVKQILTLHLPISEYDTLGSDSESNAVRTNQEMMSFTNKIRGGADRSTSSSEISPPTGSMGRKLYPRGKNKGKGAHLNKRHVRSSSGYPSYNQETTFSISQSINDHIHPPTS